MNDEAIDALDALTQSDSYVNKKAADSIAQSLFHDYQMLMMVKMFSLVLSRFEDPDDAKKCLSDVKDDWCKRSEYFLKSEAKRFQDLILKSSATDQRKLPDELQNIFSDYSRTLSTAYSTSTKAVDDIMNMLINTIQPKKENENDEGRTQG